VLRLVDGSVVVVEMERFISARKNSYLIGLRLDAKVIVAGIMPAAHIQSGNGFTRLIFCQRAWPLMVDVEMIAIDGSHPRVIQVTRTMPHAILFLHTHMAHLNRQKMLDYGLPHTALVNSLAIWKATDLESSYATT
jgi:hypothetical protein